jgi:lysophospholipase L1-like esterase
MKATFVLLLISLVGCGGSMSTPKAPTFAGAPQPQPLQPPTVPRSGVVFLGDSITGRWDLDSFFPGKGYINGGMFGYRTDQLRALLPDVLSGKQVCHGLDGDPQFPLVCTSLPKPPATIVLFAGWNDLTQARDDHTLADLRGIIDTAHGQGVRVILCSLYRWDSAHLASWMQPFSPTTTPPFPYSADLLPLDDGIDSTQGTDIVDLYVTFFGQSDYTIDGLHLNSTGYAEMHDALIPKL